MALVLHKASVSLFKQLLSFLSCLACPNGQDRPGWAQSMICAVPVVQVVGARYPEMAAKFSYDAQTKKTAAA